MPSSYAPEPRNFICVAELAQPVPVYHVEIRHCSGCSLNDTRHCGPAAALKKGANDSAEVNFKVAFGGSELSVVTLVGPLFPLRVTSTTGADVIVSGVVPDASRNAIEFVLIDATHSFSYFAAVTFPTASSFALSVRDISGKHELCSTSGQRGSHVLLNCTRGFGAVSVSGQIL